MADMVQQFSAVTLSNEIMNYEIYMTAAIVTKMNEGSSLIIIQQFIIFFKSFNLHREHRNIVNYLGSRLISSGCSIHRLRRALYREPLLLPEETNRTHLWRGMKAYTSEKLNLSFRARPSPNRQNLDERVRNLVCKPNNSVLEIVVGLDS